MFEHIKGHTFMLFFFLFNNTVIFIPHENVMPRISKQEGKKG